MTKIIVLFLLLLGSAILCLASVELTNFQIYPVVDHSQLEWTTGVEESFQMFVIERSADSRTFFAVGQVPARGSYSQYSFADNSPLDQDSHRLFYYRLKMVNQDGSFRYSDVREVSLSFSAVQHTWGSIKAMFR